MKDLLFLESHCREDIVHYLVHGGFNQLYHLLQGRRGRRQRARRREGQTISAKCDVYEELENVGKLTLSITTERSTSKRNFKMLEN